MHDQKGRGLLHCQGERQRWSIGEKVAMAAHGYHSLLYSNNIHDLFFIRFVALKMINHDKPMPMPLPNHSTVPPKPIGQRVTGSVIWVWLAIPAILKKSIKNQCPEAPKGQFLGVAKRPDRSGGSDELEERDDGGKDQDLCAQSERELIAFSFFWSSLFSRASH